MRANFRFETGLIVGVATTTLVIATAFYFGTRLIRSSITDKAREGSLTVCNRLQTDSGRRDCYTGTLYLMEAATDQLLGLLPLAGHGPSIQADHLLDQLAADQQVDRQAVEIKAVTLQLSAAGKNPALAQPMLKLVDVLAKLTSQPRNDLLPVALHAFTQNQLFGLDPQKFTETTAYLATISSRTMAQADYMLTRTFEGGYDGITTLNVEFPTLDSRQINHLRELSQGNKQEEMNAEALEGFRVKFLSLLVGGSGNGIAPELKR